MALGAVWAHRFRSGLTILGIVIGITTVVTVASLLTGLRQGIVDLLPGVWARQHLRRARQRRPQRPAAPAPKNASAKPFSPSTPTILKLRRAPSKTSVSRLFIHPRRRQRAEASRSRVSSPTTSRLLMGSAPNLYDISPREFRSGRFFTPEEERSAANASAILGSELGEALFPAGDAIGKPSSSPWRRVHRRRRLRQAAKGGFFGENGMDRQIAIPLETARAALSASRQFLLDRQGPARHARRRDRRNPRRAAPHPPHPAKAPKTTSPFPPPTRSSKTSIRSPA